MAGKLLFTASTYSHILNFHLPYLRHFQDLGWSVHVACGGPPALIPYTDKMLDLPFEKSMWSPRNFKAAAILRNNVRTENYTAIITHTSLAAFFTRFALLGLKQRPMVINMVHGYLFDESTPYLKQKLLLSAEQWMAPQTDLLLTMNQWDFETARRYHLGETIVHIPGIGVDFSKIDKTNSTSRARLRETYRIASNAFVLIYAAEFSKRKSQAVLIHAMQQLPDNVILVLAGDGALRQECQELAHHLGVENRVLFPGYIQNMPDWYAAADAAVSASRSEGLPFNIMEAMYAGLPVVASGVKGHLDLIEDGTTGLLYPYGNANVCAAQILRLLGSETLMQTMADQARENVKQYGIDRVLPAVLAQYATLLPDKIAL